MGLLLRQLFFFQQGKRESVRERSGEDDKMRPSPILGYGIEDL